MREAEASCTNRLSTEKKNVGEPLATRLICLDKVTPPSVRFPQKCMAEVEGVVEGVPNILSRSLEDFVRHPSPNNVTEVCLSFLQDNGL